MKGAGKEERKKEVEEETGIYVCLLTLLGQRMGGGSIDDGSGIHSSYSYL